MKRLYFRWLCDKINDEEDVVGSHKKLLKEMYVTQYVFGNPSDGNRAGDGLALRKSYEMDGGKELVADHLDGFPSILEVFVAFAIRIEKEYLASRTEGDQTSKWFWEMMYNAGLAELSDGKWDPKEFEQKLFDALVHVNGVTFFKNCNGCKYVGTENLWQQMLAWANDKLFERGILGKNGQNTSDTSV